jgi:orotate phosphoribosyltransferase
MAEGREHAASAAHLKFLRYKRQIRFGNFKWKSGTRMIGFTSARDFSKFVKGRR